MTVPPQASSSKLDESKYVDIDRILDRKGPWTEDHFVGGQQVCPLRPLQEERLMIGKRCSETGSQDLGNRSWGTRM